jgi:hypothetical protein
MTDQDFQSKGTDGKLVKRFQYPDGRLTALIAVGNDWQVVVFASSEAANAFAKHFNLTVEELKDGTQVPGGE